MEIVPLAATTGRPDGSSRDIEPLAAQSQVPRLSAADRTLFPGGGAARYDVPREWG